MSNRIVIPILGTILIMLIVMTANLGFQVNRNMERIKSLTTSTYLINAHLDNVNTVIRQILIRSRQDYESEKVEAVEVMR